MKSKFLSLLILSCCSLTPGLGQTGDFAFKRDINPLSSKQWCQIILPNDVIAHTRRDFEDLRIYRFENSDTVEVPYLLKIQEDQVKEVLIDIQPFNKSTKNGVLYETFEMPQDSKVNFIDLGFFETNFDGLAGMEGSNDQKEWFTIMENRRVLQLIKQYGGSEDFDLTSFNFPTSTYKFLRINLRSNDGALEKDFAFGVVKAYFKRTEVIPGNTISYRVQSVSSKVDARNKQTILEAEFEDPSFLNKITLNILSDEHYQRRFILETLRDSIKSEKGWVFYYNAITKGYITSIDSSSISFPYQKVKKLRLTIDNLDSPPLTIKKINAFGPQVVLLTKLDQGNNSLYYGNKTIPSAAYDLQFFEDKIPVNVPSAALAEPQSIAQESELQSPLFEKKLWLWVVMTVVIALLGFFTTRMMKKA